jgi:hypothetical protein
VNRIATFVIGFVLGGVVVGGAIDLADTDDSTSRISEVEDAYGDELERELHPYLGDRAG